MKLASFRKDGKDSWGIADEQSVSDIGAVVRSKAADLRSALAFGVNKLVDEAYATAKQYRLSEIDWLPVIPNPGKILCVGLNYDSHRRETGRDVQRYPTIFIRVADSQIGHLASLERPLASKDFDYEGELAVVIGKAGRHIARGSAMEHVAGFSCYNDATVRDWQRHTSQFTPGKNFPGTGAFGPWLITPDEVSNLGEQTLTTRLNGKVVQEAQLKDMIFSIEQVIEYCSEFVRLEIGDVISTGTPGGVGFKREPPLSLKQGDTIEVEITGIGRLSNCVKDEAAR
jgi:2-keto-4-pentenoate hydratase/2-oxohepta-3-ene-1,7-dioic acid hydratase in catechol pathway